MKILAVRLKNLASLEGEIELDFTKEPLKSAGIFAITGPTGSGKSTILDALCLALYAKTPRYLQAKEQGINLQDVENQTLTQGDIRSILRRGTAEGSAEVDFVGVDSVPYRATWSVRRARNNPAGSLQNYRLSGVNLSTGIPLSGTNSEIQKEIERLVGLSFDQFTRSVLLAQGDFTAFLKADKHEKADLLEKLTGTSIYSEISKHIYERTQAEKKKLDALTIQFESIALLKEEEIHSLHESIDSGKVKLNELSKQAEELKKEQLWFIEKKRLETFLDEAEAKLIQAVKNQEEANEREVHVQHVLAASSQKPKIEALKEKEADFQREQKREHEISTTLQIVKQQVELANQQVNDQQQQLRDAEVQKEQAIPLLREARNLDLLLTEKQQQKSKVEQLWEKLTTDLKTLKLENKLKLEEKKKILSHIAVCTDWLDQRESYRAVFEQFSYVESKLKDVVDVRNSIRNATQFQQENKQKLTIHEANEQQFNNQLEQLRSLVEEKVKKKNERFETWNAIAHEDIERRKNTLYFGKEELSKAQVHWNYHQRLVQDKSEKVSRYNQIKQEKTIEEEKMPIAKQREISALEVVHRLTEKREVVNLALSEHVEYLRTKLKENEPCPVCGGMHHPYKNKEPQFNSVLNQLEEELSEARKTYEKERIAAQQQEFVIMRLIDEGNGLTSELLKAESKIQESLQTWRTLALYKKVSVIPDEEKKKWFEDHEKQLNDEFLEVSKELKRYQTAKSQWEVLREEVTELESQITMVEKRVADERAARNLTLTKLEQVSLELEKSDQIKKKIEDELSAVFGNKDWVADWQQDSTNFVNRLKNDYQTWLRTKETLEIAEKQLQELTQILTRKEAEVSSINREKSEKELELSRLKTELSGLHEQRKALFNGESAEIIEQTVDKKIKESKSRLEQNTSKRQTLTVEITKAETELASVKKRMQELWNVIELKQQELNNWIRSYSKEKNQVFTSEEVEGWFAKSEEWIKQEQQKLTELKKAVESAFTVKKERENRLATHVNTLNPLHSIEELTIKISQMQVEIEEMNKRLNGWEFELKADTVARAKVQDLIKKAESQRHFYENWSKLNELIGSADGKKFRQLAQEFTLEVLLSYANVHLETLSRRYALQRIPESLAIQVTDYDMGNEIRSVYSLSGGESFLVSLALALALASLTTNKMKVESLFIDEGFGSLDPNTLQIAMDALERLHNQGRKVGVISHVQEMTERLSVQIRVTKLSGGKSVVEVV